MSTKTGVAPRRAIAPTVAKNVYGVVITSSPGPMSSAIRQASSASLPEDTPIACAAPAIAGDRLLALLHLRTQDEVLRLHHLRDRRLDLGLDASRYCAFRSSRRNIHDIDRFRLERRDRTSCPWLSAARQRRVLVEVETAAARRFDLPCSGSRSPGTASRRRRPAGLEPMAVPAHPARPAAPDCRPSSA